MKYIFFLIPILSFSVHASIIGISTHPLNEEARVLSAEMTGYLSQRHEVGMGLRYTQELSRDQFFDVSASGAQDSRALVLGGGIDFGLLKEEIYQPRISVKPYMQYHKIENDRFNLIGMAPTMRKGFSLEGNEFFPYLAVPTGIRIDSSTDKYTYYASLTMGASMPFPGAQKDQLLLSLEANRDLGASSDYIGCLLSWVWK
jgi:hypothetical protein